MVICLKDKTRHGLSLKKRDKLGLNSRDRINLKIIFKNMSSVGAAIYATKKCHKFVGNVIKMLTFLMGHLYFSLLRVIVVDYVEDPKYIRSEEPLTFENYSLPPGDSTYSGLFRFNNIEQLQRLKRGFMIPDRVEIKRSWFTGDEILIISLLRLSYPSRWCDVQAKLPRDKVRTSTDCGKAFYWLIDFLIANWGYLLLNNISFWVGMFPHFANQIRLKLQNLVTENYRQIHPEACILNGIQTGFAIFGFIDNTIMAMCRPGGGPLAEGEHAPRLSKEVQQTWSTGWKKLHGLKWQTVSLPNGLEMHAWGPLSCRRNDNHMLNKSAIKNKIRDAQLGHELQYKIHGDSAYSEDNYLASGGGRGMASVRETIEWNYKDVKTTWKYIDYKHALKLHNQPLAKIFFVCMLLRNAHSCMNSNQTALYFECMPPSFEEWLSQGPKAHPIDDTIFKA